MCMEYMYRYVSTDDACVLVKRIEQSDHDVDNYCQVECEYRPCTHLSSNPVLSRVICVYQERGGERERERVSESE